MGTEKQADNVLDSSFLVDDPPEAEERDDKPEPEAAQAAPNEAGEQKIKLSRREKARQRDEVFTKEIGGLRETLEKRDQENREWMQRVERENAELRGEMRARASQPAAEPRDKGPDPDKLMDEANALLDKKDFNGWTRKYAEAVKAQVYADERFARTQQPQQAAQQPQINPALQFVANQYGDVVGNRSALRIAIAHADILAEQGMPDGPDRWKRALEEGRRFLGQQEKPTQQFDKKTRSVLSQTPTVRNGAGNGANGGDGEESVTLNEHERKMAKDFKMDVKTYAKHLVAMHPERRQRD